MDVLNRRQSAHALTVEADKKILSASTVSAWDRLRLSRCRHGWQSAHALTVEADRNPVCLDCQCMGPASAKHTVQLGKAAEARGFLDVFPPNWLCRAAGFM